MNPAHAAPRPPSRQELRTHPAVRNYTLFSLASMFLLVVCLADRGLGWWCLMPAVVGGLSLLAHWSIGPPLVIVSLTGLLLSSSRYRPVYPYWGRDPVPTAMDLLLCAAVLGYVVGHYRLLSLVRHVFPADPRRPLRGPLANTARRRSADLVSAGEMTRLVLTLPLWTGTSILAWGWLIEEAPALDMPVRVWRTLRMVWAILAVLALTAIVAGYLRQTTATPEESLLYLQDQVLAADARRARPSPSLADVGAATRPARKGDVMRFWWRELGGWLLIGLGLLCFGVVWQFCKRRWLLEAMPMTVIGMMIFWGGIHLLKVAVAVRICQQAQDRLYPASKKKE